MTTPQTTVPTADLERMCHDLGASAVQYAGCAAQQPIGVMGIIVIVLLFAFTIFGTIAWFTRNDP